ncbi:MAG: hypothetical protein J7M40_02315 [Planctomycetes bacterium]|nr:hypothetical protein [Planctomycetota bacterium]
MSESNKTAVTKYIATQDQDYRTMTFDEEFRRFLNRHHVDYDERYVWGQLFRPFRTLLWWPFIPRALPLANLSQSFGLTAVASARPSTTCDSTSYRKLTPKTHTENSHRKLIPKTHTENSYRKH